MIKHAVPRVVPRGSIVEFSDPPPFPEAASDEDRMLLQNVALVAASLQYPDVLGPAWGCEYAADAYILRFVLHSSCSLSLSQLLLVESVSPTRVAGISLVVGSDAPPRLLVKVLRRDAAVQVDHVRIITRRRRAEAAGAARPAKRPRPES